MKLTQLLTLAVMVLMSSSALAGNERASVLEALNDYIQGTSYSDPEQIKSAFQKDANLYLGRKGEPLWTVPAKEYISWFENKPRGAFTGRVGEILSLDIEGKIATAKAEIIIPKKQIRFVDMFLLKKLDGNWKIISKSAVSAKSNHNGERILFIVSNAHFHGDSKLPAGASFSELVHAYDEFKQAGYTVDFVSPNGGATPLAYINTSNEMHKKYLYNQTFMYALKHTKKPSEVEPSLYRAVHYIGGSNAMYGVAENKEIQAITMEIYEKHNGIVSSVCHGTAGIVNLKTNDGKYLVSGKKISGYPDIFENTSRAYYKEFPFSIENTIEKRGGDFIYGKRNESHVEVDGRIVTGQNFQSSRPVAKKMIELLKRS